MAFPGLAHDPGNRRGTVVSLHLGCVLPQNNSHRTFVVIIYGDPLYFAVVGFQDVLDSFVSVYESCWVIKL